MHGTQQNDITRHAGFAQGVVIIRRQETNSAYIRLFQQGRAELQCETQPVLFCASLGNQGQIGLGQGEVLDDVICDDVAWKARQLFSLGEGKKLG